MLTHESHHASHPFARESDPIFRHHFGGFAVELGNFLFVSAFSSGVRVVALLIHAGVAGANPFEFPAGESFRATGRGVRAPSGRRIERSSPVIRRYGNSGVSQDTPRANTESASLSR